MKLATLLFLPLFLYCAVSVTLFFAQSRILFPRGAIAPGDPLPASAQPLQIRTSDGQRLHGSYLPAARPGKTRIVLLGFGGNGWNADAMALYLHELYPQADAIVFHYRGYAPSEGSPSAAALIADAPMIYDLVRDRVGDVPIVAVGFSIGSGVAGTLAAERPLAGVILVTPFDSLTGVAADRLPWLPVSLLMRHPIEAAESLRNVDTPIAVIAAGRDEVIPAARTAALKKDIRNLAFSRTIAAAGHNDIYRNLAFRAAMIEALQRVVMHGRTSG